MSDLMKKLSDLCNDKSYVTADQIRFSGYGCDLSKIEDEIKKLLDELTQFGDLISKLKYLRSILRTVLSAKYQEINNSDNSCNINCK